MPSRQKEKGNQFEREISQFLTDQFGSPFCRVPNSGAFIGGKNSQRKQTLSEDQVRSFKGDIIPGPGFEFMNIECKSYKSFAFHQLFGSAECKQLDTWIDQCMMVADPGDLNLLFMKFSRQGTYVATPVNAQLILPYNGLSYYSKKHGTWYFAAIDLFFELNKEIIKKFSKTSFIKPSLNPLETTETISINPILNP
jgi:Holliday junction resolvase